MEEDITWENGDADTSFEFSCDNGSDESFSKHMILTVRVMNKSAGITVADEVRSPMEELPCLLRFDWSKPIDAESGRGKELGRSENKRPDTRRSWNLKKKFQDPIE
ncbi:hypothetical protein TNCV_912491 [Trichonephila clavipes]|nr:hypothetical protein TNCV_912491 [Trichonephila clavipes]